MSSSEGSDHVNSPAQALVHLLGGRVDRSTQGQGEQGEMNATLNSSDLMARRTLLWKLAAWAELRKAGGKVALTLPRRDAGLYLESVTHFCA